MPFEISSIIYAVMESGRFTGFFRNGPFGKPGIFWSFLGLTSRTGWRGLIRPGYQIFEENPGLSLYSTRCLGEKSEQWKDHPGFGDRSFLAGGVFQPWKIFENGRRERNKKNLVPVPDRTEARKKKLSEQQSLQLDKLFDRVLSLSSGLAHVAVHQLRTKERQHHPGIAEG